MGRSEVLGRIYSFGWIGLKHFDKWVQTIIKQNRIKNIAIFDLTKQQDTVMKIELVERRCLEKEQELLDKYFGNLVKEAAHERPADGDA